MQLIFLGALALAYLQALVQPVWALAGYVIAAQTLNGYVPGTPFSVRLSAALLSMLFAAPLILRAMRTWNRPLQLVLLPSFAFFVIATVVNCFFSEPTYVFKYLRLQFVHLVMLVLVATTITTRRDVKIIAYVLLAVACASALFAVAQQFTTNPLAYPSVNPDDVSQYDGRSVGLTRSPVSLADDLMLVLPLALGVMLSAPWRGGLLHIPLGPCVMLVSLGVYFSFTRSALLGLGPGLLVMAAFVRGWRRAAVIGVLVLAPVLYVLLEGTGLIGKRLYLGVDDDVSAASHLATIQVGFELALDHWVTGIGHESFEESSTAYAGLVTGELARLGARSRLGEAKVHNDYLNVWFSWGIGALTAYLAVFAGTLFNCLVAARSRDWLIRGAAIGCIGGVVTYAVGSATHNYLDAGIVLWLFAGLSAALVPLAQIAPVQAPARRIALLRRSLRAPVRSLA